MPTEDDAVKWAINSSSHRIAYVTLDNDYSVGWVTNKHRSLNLSKSGTADTVSLTIKGQLGSPDGYQQHVVNSGVKLIVDTGAALVGAHWDGTASTFTINSGAEVDVYGDVESRLTTWTVPTGAVLRFAPSVYNNFAFSGTPSSGAGDVYNLSGGDVYFPNGLAVTSGNQYYANAINHSAGTVTFGGNFTSAEAGWTYTWSGGTLSITNDCEFGNNISLVIPASSIVALDVASDKTFSVPSFRADPKASITKTGAGIFALAPTEAAIAVNAGGIGLGSSTYNLSSVTFAEGTKVALTATGVTITSYDSSLKQNATFEADFSSAGAGTVILVSNDSELLKKAQAELSSSVPAGLALAVNGTTLSVEAQSAYNFCGSGDILDSTYWGETMPGTGAEVAITGATTVATLSSGPLPAWRSIEVKDGATLRIATDAILQPVVLNKDATLQIDNNAVVEIKYTGDLSCVATAERIPVLSVASGAKLKVPGGMKFSNVDIDLKGELDASSGGGVTFGYAAAGDTTYIGLKVDGGTVSLSAATSGSKYDTDPLEFCCSETGGSVVAVDSLVFTNATIKPWTRSSYPFTENPEYGFHMGVNNPELNVFTVVFDNTSWGVSGKTIITGGAVFRLQNGAKFQNAENLQLHGRTAEISQSAKVVVGNGGEFRLNAMGDYGNQPLNVNPTSADHQSIVVEEGGVFESYRMSGNSKGVFTASGDSDYCIFMPSNYHVGSSATYDTKNIPFEGLSSVNIAEGKTLSLTTRNMLWTDGKFGDNSGDRVVSLANVPITGAGSIALDNANVNKFGVIVTCGSNTATGSASVVAPGEGEGETTLYFADGANWEGTVTAGQFAMTNLVDAAAACTNSFGTVDLAAGTELQIRVWKTGGVIVAHDGLNVDSYVNHGGKIVLVAMDEELSAGDSIELGTIGGESEPSEPPAVKGGWRTIVNEGRLQLKYSRGFSVIFR